MNLLILFSDMEAMYKFKDSNYYTAPHPPSPRPPNAFRPTPTPTRRPQSGMSRSQNSHRSSSSTMSRAKSAPLQIRKVPKLTVPTPQQCWEEAEFEREMNRSPTPSTDDLPPTPQPNLHEMTSPVPSTDSKRSRIQSAAIRRDRPTPPPRPVKSAGTSRSTPLLKLSDQAQVPCDPAPATPVPTPYIPAQRPTTAEINEENLREYGWKQQAHGNPFKLK